MKTIVEAPPTQVYQVFIRATPERIWGLAAQLARPDDDVWGDESVIESDPRRLVHGWRSLRHGRRAGQPRHLGNRAG